MRQATSALQSGAPLSRVGAGPRRARIMGATRAMGIALTDWVGLAGSALIVVAYFFNQRGQLSSADWRFPALNLAGAILILFSLMFAWNLPSVLIEAFWVAISLYGLARARRS